MRRAVVAIVAVVAVSAACGGRAPATYYPGLDPAALPRLVDLPPPRGPGAPPAVIVLIGDGMGPGQLAAASLYRHGVPGALALQALAHRGTVRTRGPSGITDSAAAATAIATGGLTYNGHVGVDRDGRPVESILERAAARGWATGVVTTTSLPHATPAAFTAHVDDRDDFAAIAADQVGATRPDVMLGGGTRYFERLDPRGAGYTVVTDGAGLAAAAARATRLFGAFAPEHLTYMSRRRAGGTEPALADLAAAALTVLDRDPDGFFLVIEGGRIDHAGHHNDLANAVAETLAFDDVVAEVAAWARARGNATVIVTADHETGGLAITEPAPAGFLPGVRWRWSFHTGTPVLVTGEGPGTEAFDGEVVDHTRIYEVARARVDAGTRAGATEHRPAAAVGR